MLINIKLLRDEKKISQEKLGEIVGRSQQSVNEYENGKTEPDITTLKAMADYFETSVDFIVAYSDIRRRIEPVSEFSLNEQEAGHMRMYRKLKPSAKEKFDALMEEMI